VRSSIALLLAVLACFGLAACGGGGSGGGDTSGDGGRITDAGPSVEEEVKVAALAAVENGDAASFCRTQASKAYLRTVYGGDAKDCAKSEGTVPKHPPKAEAGMAKVEPDQRHATVTVSLEGGDLDGTTGEIEMVKEGDGWKVDEFDDDFIRSAFLASVETVDEGALSTPGMKACFSRQVKGLPAATVRELTYASDQGNVAKQNKGLLKMAENCPQSALAEYGARALTDELDVKPGQHKPGYVKCLYKGIYFGLEVSGITTELLAAHPNQVAVSALEGIVEGAKAHCGG
jgi:hypothetical protein